VPPSPAPSAMRTVVPTSSIGFNMVSNRSISIANVRNPYPLMSRKEIRTIFCKTEE
jgi:hypothetical protein